MATLDQYAQWLINNQDKKDTPDFQTVADAYKALRSQGGVGKLLTQPQEPQEESGFFRQLADVPVNITRGVAQGVRMVADAFGADNPASAAIKNVEDYLGDLLSATAKNNQQEIGRILKEAEDKGVGAQLKAGIQAFLTAPVDLLSQALGTAAPIIAGGLAGAAARLGAAGVGAITTGLGTTMGLGVGKGAIYEATKEALLELKIPEEIAEERAQAAQSYGGENLDQILLAGGLGAVASRFGIEPRSVSALSNRILGKAAERQATTTAQQAAPGMLTRAATTGAGEAIPEFFQGAQEQLAQNIALQREGLDVPTMRGVVGAGTLEGLAGLGLGAGIGAVTPEARPTAEYKPKDPKIAGAIDALRQRGAEDARAEPETDDDVDARDEPSIPVPEGRVGEVPGGAVSPEPPGLAVSGEPVSEPGVGEGVEPSALETAPTVTPTVEPTVTPTVEPTVTTEPTPTVTPPVQTPLVGMAEPFSLRSLVNQEDPKQLAKFDEILSPPEKKAKTPTFQVATPALQAISNAAQKVADFITQQGYDPNSLPSIRQAPQEVQDAARVLNSLRQDAENIVTSVRQGEERFAKTKGKTKEDVEKARETSDRALQREAEMARQDIKDAEKFLADPSSGTGQIVFSQVRQVPPGEAPPARGMSTSGVETTLQPIIDTLQNLPTIRNVQNIAELPPEIQAQIADQEVQPKGLYDPNTATVYTIADNLENAADAILTFIHETVGHFGLRAILGERYSGVMRQIYNGNNDVKAKADKKMQDSKKLPLDTAVEEVLAEMAEDASVKAQQAELANKKSIIPKPIRQLIAAIRRIFSDLARPLTGVSDADIQDLIANARRFVVGEELQFDPFTEGVASDDPRAARSDGALFSQTPFATSSKFNPNATLRSNPENAPGQILNWIRGHTTWNDVKSRYSPNNLMKMAKDARGKLFKIYTLRMLNDTNNMLGVNKMPEMAESLRTVDGLVAMRQSIIKEVSDIQADIDKVRKQKNGEDQLALLGEIANEATIRDIDPDTNKKDAVLNSAWDLLDDSTKEVYRKMRNFYEAQMDGMVQDMIDKISTALDSDSFNKAISEILMDFGSEKQITKYKKEMLAYADQIEKDAGADPTAKADAKVKADAIRNAKSKRVQNYFPLRRYGNYWFQVGKGKNREFYTFESIHDRDHWLNERRKELLAEGKTKAQVDDLISPDNIGNRLLSDESNNILDTVGLTNKIEALLDKATYNSTNKIEEKAKALAKAGGRTYTTSADVTKAMNDMRKEINDGLKQMMYMMTPDSNFRRMFINRQGIQGASRDIARVFATTGVNIAYQRSKVKYASNFYEGITRAKEQLRYEGFSDAKVLKQDLISELESRGGHILGSEPTGTMDRISNGATQFTFLYLLTAPASGLINIAGMAAIGYPYLGARFGYDKAASTMAKFMWKYGSTAPQVTEGTTVFPTLEKADLGSGEQNKFLQEAYARFTHDNDTNASLVYDVTGETERRLGKTGAELTDKFIRGMTAVFHHSERFQRETMLMSAYEMSYDQNIASGMDPETARETAIQDAKQLTSLSLADFTRAAKPPVFTGPVAKVLYQFKQYSLAQTYNMFTNTYVGWLKPNPDDNPEIAQFKKESRRRMYGVLGMTGLFAGLSGMPIYSAVGFMVEAFSAMVAAISDDPDDEIEDFESWMHNYLAEMVGEKGAASVMRGPIGQVTSMGIADRTSLDLAQLWMRDSGNQRTAEDAFKEQLFNLLGPTVSVAASVFKAKDLLDNYNPERAIETVSPTILRSILQANRYAREGEVTTARGVVIEDDLDYLDIAARAIGFTPEKVLQKQKAAIKRKGMEQEINLRRQRILTGMFMGVWYDNERTLDQAFEAMDKFNQKYPEKAITGETIQKSILNRAKALAEAEAAGGTRIDRKLLPRLLEEVPLLE